MKSSMKLASSLSLALILASNAQATALPPHHSTNIKNLPTFFPAMTPRFTLAGGTGDFSYTHGDFMAALFGSNNGIAFIDAQGKFGHDNAWFGSLGLGAREIIDNKSILGVYIFGDRSESGNNNLFWDVSPGIEWMNNVWDAHINGYFPVGDTQRNSGLYYGDQIGISKYVSFSGHAEYDALFRVGESVGTGVDSEVGYTIPHTNRLRVFVGGYYFDPRNAEHILGGLAGIQVQMSQHVLVRVDDSYDNDHHNTFMASLILRFGGPSKTGTPDIHDRLLDPIPRNLGSRRTGMAIPSKQTASVVNHGGTLKEHGDIWFFSPNGQPFNPALGANQGTINNPLAGSSFTQGTVNSIHGLTAGALLYFKPGDYPINNSLGTNGNRIQFFNGQSLYGRTSDYSLPASSSNRPLFTGGFNVTGHNTLSDFNLTGTGTSENTGIYGDDASNVTIENINVSDYTGASGGNAMGIHFENGDNLTLNNVSVSDIKGGNGANGNDGNDSAGSNGTNGGNASGIKLDNESTVTMKKITVKDITGGQGGNGGNGSDGAIGMSGITAGPGGDGKQGGNGGNGGNAQGVSINNSSGVNISSGSISNITGGAGGHGGDGGDGGVGGNSLTANGGNGGNGAVGGDGGTGGSAQGIAVNNSTGTLKFDDVTMNNFTGGNGGTGGDAGNGGNGGNSSTTATGGNGGNGAQGGTGGQAGAAQGVNLNGGNVELSNSTITNLNGGTGGNGGIAGNGGNGGNAISFGGNGGNGGDGGDGGDGGVASGTNVVSGAILETNVTKTNIVNGSGGLGYQAVNPSPPPAAIGGTGGNGGSGIIAGAAGTNGNIGTDGT